VDNATLLIVEDNVEQQLIYKQLCQRFDCSTVFCSSGDDAVEALQSARYAAVIIEVTLPGLNQLENISRLKAVRRADDRQTPIIAVADQSVPNMENPVRNAGADDFLLKPFSVNAFRKLLLRTIYEPAKPNLKLLNKRGGEHNTLADD
jgi:CheY-like chemotaxis protein